MIDIIVPKIWVSTDRIWSGAQNRALLFFAGPVRGGGDWQHRGCDIVAAHERLRNSVVVTPTRWTNGHALASRFMRGPNTCFPRQLNYERHYLALAGLDPRPGCVLFWLRCESEEDPHPGPEPYSMDTRGELAEWRMRMAFQNARVVIGAEPEYHGLSQIQRNYSLELGYEFPIYQTLEATVNAAAEMAFR